MVVQAFGESPDVSWKYPFCSNPGVSICQTRVLIFSAVCGKKVMRFPFSLCAVLLFVSFTQTNAKEQVVTYATFNTVE